MPGAEKFQNFNAGTNLAAPMLLGDDHFSVVDPSKLSSDGSFSVLIDSEYITVPVGGVSGGTYSGVTRGEGVTSPAPHAGGSIVTQTVSARSAFRLWPNLVATATKTGNYTANPQESVQCNSSGGTFAVALPLAASAGQNCPVAVCDVVAGFGLTVIASGGDTIIAWAGSILQQAVLFISDGVSLWMPIGGSSVHAQTDLAPPPQTITVNRTLLATEVWVTFAAGNYIITISNAVGGRLYRIQHDSLAILEDAEVQLSRGTGPGAGTYLIENPNTGTFDSTPVPLNISQACYEFMLDARYNILRCMGF